MKNPNILEKFAIAVSFSGTTIPHSLFDLIPLLGRDHSEVKMFFRILIYIYIHCPASWYGTLFVALVYFTIGHFFDFK